MQDQRIKEIIIQEAKNVDKDWLEKKIKIEEALNSGSSNAKWIAFLDLVTEGDELWEFSSSAESWQALAGRKGIALVRNGEIFAVFITIMS